MGNRKLFKDKKETDDFAMRMYRSHVIIGGNGLEYVTFRYDSTHFGTQHYQYPWAWVKPLVKLDSFSLIGIWHASGGGISLSSMKIKENYFEESEIDELKKNYNNNWNAVRCGLEDSMKKADRDNLLGICIYCNEERKISNYIIVKN